MNRTAAALKGGGRTLIGQWGKYCLQILSLVVLARLLDPDDFGLYTMVIAVAGVALVLADSGLSLASLQAQTLTDAQRSNLFWLNVLIGLACALALFLGAPAIASFYGEPDLVPLCQLTSVALLVVAASVQFRVELNRRWRFGSLAWIEVLAQAVGLGVAVLAALLGAGPFALVLQLLGAAVVSLVAFVTLARWVPALPSRSGNISSVVRLATATVATQLVTYTSSNVDNLVIGRASGPDALGVYSRAYQLFMLPIQQFATPMTRVAVPALASLDDAEAFQAHLRRVQLVMAYVVIGVLLFICACAGPIVELVLGGEWLGASQLLVILAIGGIFQSLGYIYYWACLARARMTALFWCESVGRVIMVALIVLVAPNGPAWVAAAHSIGLACVWVGSTFVCMRLIGVRVAPLVAVALRPLLVWGTALAGTVIVFLFVPESVPSILDIVLGGLCFAGVLGAASLIPAVRADIAAVVRVARKAAAR